MADKEMRAVYAETLMELAEKDPRIVLLEADLMKASGTGVFKNKFPERTFNVGVAEANMVGIAAGLSASGKIPFADSFGCFAGRRTYDQFFVSANYARLNVKLTGTDPGISAAYNGGTHMPFEDMGIMRNIPKLVVFEPSDPVSLKALVKAAAAHPGCTYMRLHRKPMPALYPEGETFQLGKGKVLAEGKDVTLVGLGAIMVNEALRARQLLEAEGISAAVLDMHTIKPIDVELITTWARKTGALVTCENHQTVNGLASAVAEVLAEHCPALLARVGIRDEFGEVGTQEYLLKRFKLTAEDIRDEAKALLGKKRA